MKQRCLSPSVWRAAAVAAWTTAAVWGAPAGAQIDRAADVAADIPAVVFPGNGIGADYSAYQPPKTAWQVERVRAEGNPDHCYLPGQPIRFDVTLKNGGNTPLSVSGAWRWVGDVSADERGGVAYQSLGGEATWPLASTALAAKGGSATVRLERTAPARHGVLALFLDASDGAQSTTSRWVTNVAVLFPAAPGPRPDSPFMGDQRGVRAWQRLRELPTLGKLGVKWLRVGADVGRVMPRPGQWNWAETDAEVASLRQAGMLALYLGGAAPAWMRSYGRLSWPRNNPNKQDASPSPDHYGDWAEYWHQVAARYKDVVRAANIWNEPWEGGGISDWGGMGARYRALQRLAKQGVLRGDPTMLVGGNDSDGNVMDNLLVDPVWATYTDLITVHGYGLSNAAVHRLIPEGMPIWNTENWYTAFSDQTVQQFLFERARGVAKVDLVILGNFFSAGYRSGGYYNPLDEKDVPDLVPQPNAAAYNALAHFLEGMGFAGELSPDRLPYQFLFVRKESTTPQAAHRAVLALFGQNGEPATSNWPQVAAGPSGSARLKAVPGISGVFDRYGNPLPAAADGSRLIPLNTQVVYVTADTVEPLRRVGASLEVVRCERPLHVSVVGPTAPLSTTPVMTIRLTNPLPQTVLFSASLSPGAGWALEPARLSGTLAAGETKEYSVRVTRGTPAPGGRDTVAFVLKTPLAQWTYREAVEVRCIARWTPPPGATASDWVQAKITPIVLREVGGGADDNAQASAAMPWERLVHQPQAGAFGRYALAYDDRYLYLMADIRSETRGELPWDQTRPDWYELHPGGYAYKRAPEWPFRGENVQLALDCLDNPADYLYPEADPLHRRYTMREADYLFGFYQARQGGGGQVWLYKRPGGPFRHRYPFSPVVALDQTVAPGAKLRVTRDEKAGVTHFEAAIPLDLMPEVAARPGARLAGAEVKLTATGQDGLYSASGHGAAKRNGSVFQPYWLAGYSLEIPWGFGR